VSFDDPLGRIEDILDAITKVQRYTKGLTLATFESDDKTVDAVMRNFIIIGEAASRLPQPLTSRYPNVPWHRMRGLRNIAVHEYARVDARLIWETIIYHLPPLVTQLREILNREPR
jgi:uncharacterized protein with HEPN domain